MGDSDASTYFSVDSAPGKKTFSKSEKAITKVSSKIHAQRHMSTEPVLLNGKETSNIGETGLPLRIEPRELRFDSVEPGVLYVMTFSVRNTTKAAQRVRIEPPKSVMFALNYIPTGVIAPGLDIRAEIECQIPEKIPGNFFKDSIVAVMGPHRVELPIYASKPAPNICFESLLNFGPIAEGVSVTANVEFQNTGSVVGRVTLKVDEKSHLKMEPSVFDVYAVGAQKVVVSVKLDPRDVGAFREFVQVLVEGNAEPMVLDVNATVLQQKLVLLSEKKGNALEQLDFGTLFYGSTATYTGVLVNSGPLACNYLVNYNDDEDKNENPASAFAEDPLAMADRPISMSPVEGVLKPFSQVKIIFRFNPKNPEPQQGFQKNFLHEFEGPRVFSGRAVIESSDAGHKSELYIKGTVVMPTVTITPMTLRFGVCHVYDRRDILISITNKCIVPVPFDFSKIAFFKVTPGSGILEPQETVSAVVSYLPSQLGKVKNVVKCVIAGGLSSIEVRLLGEAVKGEVKKALIGGTNLLPEDFNPSYKFVQPAPPEKSCEDSVTGSMISSTFSRILPAFDPNFFSETSWDERERDKGEQTIHNDAYTYSVQEIQRRAEHSKKYMDFIRTTNKEVQEKKLKAAAVSRRARGLPDTSDPYGVDMGMEKGLDAPEPKLPVADEPLWLERRVGEDAGGRGRRIPVDENRLIIKKHSDVPGTQAELRDCTKILSLEDIRLVVPSHKVLNFGRVCVTSVTAKNFVVTNDMKHSVEIRVHGLDNELKQSKPEIQIVPQGGIAGFDIYFSSRDVHKFKKAVTWTINGQHPQKLMVIAEVVNIELVMDRSQVTMTFPAESLERSHTDRIILSNPGNAPAEYMWTGSGAFQCRPEQGVIDPGKSVPITVIWTPGPVHINEDHVGLHVVGGQDQFLNIVGVVKECKTQFEEKKLSIGTLAVGQERKLMAHIKNTGTNSAVFHFDLPPEDAGILIQPMCGCIPAGDIVEVEVTVRPKAAKIYDNIVIVASVRGGKSMVLKLSGESKMPQITLLETSFIIGTVVVGSEYRVPFTLVNNGNFNASLMLDMTDHQDMRPCLEDAPVTKTVMKVSDEAGSTLEPILPKQSSLSKVVVISDGAPSGLWRITLAPNATLKAELVFAPTVARVHNFKLPLFVQGISDRPFAREIRAEGLQSRLGVSTFSVNFGDRVVSRDPGSRMTYYKEVILTNTDTAASRLSFEVRERGGSVTTSEHADPVYFVSPTKGDLATADSVAVRVTFLPQGHGDFNRELDVFVTGQADQSRPYFTISLKGSGVFPRLTFTKHRLVLPTVPLGVTTRASFDIINYGYDNLELNYRVSPTIPVPLDISFPFGSDVGLTRDRATVIVSTKSDTVTSWAGKLEFCDSDGEKFQIEICGCCDGSLLTIYPFVRQYKDRYGFVGLPEQPVVFLSKQEIVRLRMQETKRKEAQRRLRAQERQKLHGKTPGMGTDSVSRTSKGSKSSLDDESTSEPLGILDGVDLDRDRSITATESECRFLLQWMNKFIFKKPMEIDKYPECILESSGDSIIEAIEILSGKKVIETRFGDNALLRRTGVADNGYDARVQSLERLIKKYKTMMSFLIKGGALLTHVNPLFLLKLEDYVFAVDLEFRRQESSRVTSAMLTERHNAATEEWRQCCSDAWAEVLFQTLKVFVLSRVTYKEYKDCPGVLLQQEDVDDPYELKKKKGQKDDIKKEKKPSIPPELKPSNVCSQAEAILLEWANYHVRHAGTLGDSGMSDSGPTHVFNLDKRITDLDEDVGDLLPFCQIFHSHIPELSKVGGFMCGYTNVENRTIDSNFKRLQAVLTQYRLDFEFKLEELVSSSRTLLLMLLHMFLNVPALIPKNCIEFKGILGVPMKKAIELRNTSNKRVSYRITMEGSEDFVASYDSVIIDPQSTVDFEITCNARFSAPVTGRVTFWGVRDKGSGPSTMIFKLVSNITDRKPIDIMNREVSVFELETFQISIKNPYDKDCTYPISIKHSGTRASISEVIQNLPNKKNQTENLTLEQVLSSVVSSGNNTDDQQQEDEEIKRLFDQPIWCAEQSVHLPAMGSGTLTIHCLPFMMGAFTAQIVMLEESTGEFCYQIDIDVGLPKMTEKLEFSVPQVGGGTSIQRALRISPRNSSFESAVGFAVDMRIQLPRRNRARAILHQFLAYSLQSVDDSSSSFGIDIKSPYFNCQKEFTCISDYATVGQSTGNTTAARPDMRKILKVNKNGVDELSATEVNQPNLILNSAVFSFFPEKAGVYKSRVIVYSKQNELDLRIFEIIANVTTPVRSNTLHFSGPAKQLLSQEIPILNESNTEWSLHATIHGKEFSGLTSFHMRKGEKTLYTISFLAPYAGAFEGSLHLREVNSNDSFHYQLLGEADDPLSEGHLTFKCLARAKETVKIPLKYMEVPVKKQGSGHLHDGSKPNQILKVETDLPYVSGSPTVEISPNGGEYEFIVQSPVGGVMSGSITFIEVNTHALIWYTVEIEVTSPKAESTITVEATVRKAVAVEISIDNPTSDLQVLQVEIEGEGLIGDGVLTLPPGASNLSYELIYSPLVAGKHRGRIAFTNEALGEFWYSLLLNAIPAPPTRLETIECMLGHSKSIQVALENPLDKSVLLSVRISDPDHFAVVPEGGVYLDPYSQISVDLYFTPSSLTEMAYSIISFSHPAFGELQFAVDGKGLLPGVMPATEIFAPIDEIRSHTILFRNPFLHPLPVDVLLNESIAQPKVVPRSPKSPMNSSRTERSEKATFGLLLRKSGGVVLAPHSTFQVGISFNPKKLGQYNAQLQVRSNISGRNLLWCFPIAGVAEAGSSQVLPRLITKCKASLKKDVQIPLQGLRHSDLDEDEVLAMQDFTVELVVEPEFKSLVSRAFRMQPISLLHLANDPTADFALTYRMLLEPLRVFRTTVQVMVKCPGKGLWRATIDLEATDPDPDDTIRLTAAVGSLDKVSFQLSNRFLGYSTFQAYFSVHSSTHFSVSPTSGVLAPFGTDGTQFVITFAPVDYGGREKAMLNIVTDDAQWTYEVTGSYPEVNIRKDLIKSRIDNGRQK